MKLSNFPKFFRCIVLLVAACVELDAATNTNAEKVTGEMMANPYFSKANYDHWEFSGKWRSDGDQERVVFEIVDVNSGYPSAVGRGNHLHLASNPEGLSAKLIGFEFNNPYVAVYNASAISENADYELYFEVDVLTEAGVYRARSQSTKAPWNLPTSELKLEFEWLSMGAFKGDLTSYDGGGIPVEAIEDVFYRAVMKVNEATGAGREPVFVTLDNLSLTFRALIE